MADAETLAERLAGFVNALLYLAGQGIPVRKYLTGEMVEEKPPAPTPRPKTSRAPRKRTPKPKMPKFGKVR